MPRATTLEEARKVLDPRPLDFREPNPQGAKEASDPKFYTELPARREGNFKLPGPLERLRQRLLSGTRDTKLFLSGHVGSGKSTELSRLAVHPQIQEQFSVLMLRFEEQEWATLDSSQVLFRLAGALFESHKDRLSKQKRWKEIAEDLNQRIFQPMGIQAKEGAGSVEFDLVVVKLKQELKLSEKARRQFRAFGETQQSLLQDFLAALVDDIENALSADEGPNELLVVVDDLDKVRGAEAQKEIFDTNLNALLAPPLRVVYTVPTGVRFGESRADIRHNVEHLFPVRVLGKAPGSFRPEDAFLEERMDFFNDLVEHRVDPNLIQKGAVRLAAMYSGGVLRDFFRMLREGAQMAAYNDQPMLDTIAMTYALNDARLKESVGLYGPDYEALAHAHRTNELRSAEDRRYLDLSRIIESHNGSAWFDAHPLLWKLLEEHQKTDVHHP
ncbi:P-loop NTPase fold protein [Sorangium sp. So ce1153]|uniref:P-loop NTPase fold protein n=1 Tax=Sorangium sp. So ce1153 TaxID=3133333 RepID=UPI003F5F0CF3